ncbi:interferon regulatory factor 7 isoform 2-T2 [Polymixia lowei]
MQSPPKPQFANWLIEQVGTDQYVGLCYVDLNRFRVPWKHNSRKDCNDEDCKIFRAWAVASGKINEFPNDKAKWKTNFRCALNNLTKRFKMIRDNSKNSEDPHKIYEIINTEYNYENQHTENSPDAYDMIPDIYSSPTEYFPSDNEQIVLNLGLMTLDLSSQHADEQQWRDNYGQHTPVIPGSYPVIHPATVEALPVSENHTPQLPDQHSNHHEPMVHLPVQPSIYDLEISIHYRKREMLKTQVQCPRLQLHYQHEAPEFSAHALCFPTTDSLLDCKQIEYTNRILNSIQRGLLLEVRETGIYASRQDRCHVFASTSDPTVAHPEPRKLPQNTTVELLSFEKYVNELKQFKENKGGSPDYTINMCFGEKFPDGKPLEKKLIVVKVVPLICRHFHEMAQLDGASSLHSANVSLQISHDNLYDLINSVFGLPACEELQAAGPF